MSTESLEIENYIITYLDPNIISDEQFPFPEGKSNFFSFAVENKNNIGELKKVKFISGTNKDELILNFIISNLFSKNALEVIIKYINNIYPA